MSPGPQHQGNPRAGILPAAAQSPHVSGTLRRAVTSHRPQPGRFSFFYGQVYREGAAKRLAFFSATESTTPQ